MDGYETDEILSQALDLAEDVENDTIFIIQVGKNIEWRTSTRVWRNRLKKLTGVGLNTETLSRMQQKLMKISRILKDVTTGTKHQI